MPLLILFACVALMASAAYALYRQRRRRDQERQRLRQHDRIRADWEAMLRRQRGEN